MLKTILLGGAMAIAMPALAQTTGTTGSTTGGAGTMQGGTMQGTQPGTGTMTSPADPTTTTTTPSTDSATSTTGTTTTRSSRSRRSGSTTSASPTGTTGTQTTTGTQSTTTTTPGTAPDASQPQAGTTAQAQPSGGVGSVVDQEFATYDKDANGQLSKTEFGAWMDALKAKQPGNAAVKDPAYNDKAFAQADADKSSGLSKVELTTFLSGGSAAS